MLTSLYIENFAIVEKLELNFTNGMTTFTGETGAGKSIMVDALMLALGGRADASVVRRDKEKCDILACFSFDLNSPPAQWLTDHDLDLQQGEVFLRRTINLEGRSKSYINGCPFPLQKIKELCEMLVDIHGQHQHQTLLHPTTHRMQLDHYAHHEALLKQIKELYHQCQKYQEAIEQLKQQETSTDRLALLQYQIDELLNLNLQDDEIRHLHEEHQRLHHAHEYLENAQKITEFLHAEDQPNVRQMLHLALQHAQGLPASYPEIQTLIELLNNAMIQCDEALNEMATFSNRISLDPERLYTVETRMQQLYQAARKYRLDIQQLPHHILTLQDELSQLNSREQQIQHMQQCYDQAQLIYQQHAMQLRQSRAQHADKLAAEITSHIQQLGMPRGFVHIDISPLEKMQFHGMDKVEYRVCTNPGMAADSLSKIVSGGELSRISLGIQMITAQRGSTPTLIFDEVDVGIGGATAALVGQHLRHLGQRLQVFCVTHQPQVAACAHQHFRVEKITQQNQTFLTIRELTQVEKIDEISRMLGGLTISEQTRAHARELLEGPRSEVCTLAI